jgi:DNA repair protein RAD16
LPPRTVIVRRDYFSPEEKELYLSLFSDAKRQFNTYLDQGTVLNSVSHIYAPNEVVLIYHSARLLKYL